MFCPKCGKKVADGVTFCPACGTRLGGEGGQIPQGKAAPQAGQAPQRETAPQAAQGEAKPGSQKGEGHKRKAPVAAIIASIAVIVVVAAAAVGFLVLRGNGTDTGDSAAQDDQQAGVTAPEPDQEEDGDEEGAADDSADDTNPTDPGSDRFEELTVSDVTVDADAPEGPKVTLTVTNNQAQIVKDTYITANGTFTVTNNYGDEVENEDSLDLICTEEGSNTIPYLFPGENKIELIPYGQDNIVTSYTNGYTDETQSYRLQDLNSVDVSVSAGSLLDPDQYAVLDPDEYGVELQMALDGHTPVLNVSLTNKTDYRWKSATVYFVAIDANGQRAHNTNSSSNSEAFSVGPVSEQYFKVGETKQMQTNYSSDLNVDHFEVQRVVVEKELVETGNASSSATK